MISAAEDYIDNAPCELTASSKLFRFKTNLPNSVTLQPGARVMHLNNDLFYKGICNGSIGVIHDVYVNGTVRVAFPVASGILDILLGKYTSHFYLNGSRASRTQYPLCPYRASYPGTHAPFDKHSLDEDIFAKGQAYVALSRAASWDTISITTLQRDVFKVDSQMIREYDGLAQVTTLGPLI